MIIGSHSHPFFGPVASGPSTRGRGATGQAMIDRAAEESFRQQKNPSGPFCVCGHPAPGHSAAAIRHRLSAIREERTELAARLGALAAERQRLEAELMDRLTKPNPTD